MTSFANREGLEEQRMWQEAENGQMYWAIASYVFYQVTLQVEQQQQH